MAQHTDEVVERLMARLCGEEGCHTVILYGSRARGDATPLSDYDVIAFRDQPGPSVRQVGRRDGGLLDVFIYPTERLNSPDVEMMHVLGGVVLCERGELGSAFLRGLDQLHAAGPEPLAADEAGARRVWAWKMFDRASQGDVEADYRRAWLLTSQLEHVFAFRGEWYPGPKEALRLLETERPEVYAAFKRALSPGASLDDLCALVEAVNGPRPGPSS